MKVPSTVTRVTRTTALVGITALLLAGCAGGGSGDDEGSIELSVLVPQDQYPDAMEQIADAFTAENPDITIKLTMYPGGTEGDNLIKTRLATGEMEDLFLYNPGSLFQALDPDKTLVPLDDQPWASTLDPAFVQTVSTDAGMYGAPIGTSQAGGVLYNTKVYEQLGLEVPRDWQEFLDNNTKVQEAGTIVPVVQSYAADWSAQLWVLADYGNINTQDPDFPEQFTANEVSNSEQPALQAWLNFQEVRDLGFFNPDYASKTFEEAMQDVASGAAAHYPMLTGGLATVAQNNPEQLNDIGIFAMPAQNADDTTLTIWPPNVLYIPKTTEGARQDAAKAFIEFVNSEEGCALQNEFLVIQGQFVTTACTAEDAPTAVQDQVPYFEEGRTSPALEFLTPVKGPNLPGISVEVGSGIRTGEQGAALYDEDVVKQAQQQGLPGW